MIGVVVTAHNQNRHLQECLKSIYGQDYPCQVVVVDDASNPPAEGIKYNLPNAKVIRLWDNEGVQRARNIGWWELKDSFDTMLFCDADIQWKPGAFRLMTEALHTRRNTDSKVAIAYGDYDRIGAVTGMWNAGEFDIEKLRRHNYISTMSLVSTSALPNPPFIEDEQRLQDWSLWLRMVNKGFTGVYVGECLFTAFYGEDSVSSRPAHDYAHWHRTMAERYIKNAGN